jgi:ATP-dependent DNA helicase RecG
LDEGPAASPTPADVQLVDEPPAEVPPTEVPPADKPPADVPAATLPPAEVQLADEPPADEPLAEVLPTEVPPVDEPPAEVPPTEVPPADGPPADLPPGGTPQPMEPGPEREATARKAGRAEPAGLDADITTMRGIGPRTAKLMRKLGLNLVRDLLSFFPRRYVDYSSLKPINRLTYGEQVTVIGTVWETRMRRTRGRQKLVESVIGDGTSAVQCTWFNQPWLMNKLKPGTAVMISGKVDQYLGRLTFRSPEWELVEKEHLHTGRIVPVYPLTAGLRAKMMRGLVKRTVDYWARRTPDPLPLEIRQRQRLIGLESALMQIHFPANWDQLAAARRRLAFDELFVVQLGVLRQRREWQSRPGLPLAAEDDWLDSFIGQLPFELTGAQQRVLTDVRSDMRGAVPMNRLVQGDVGSGKTVVAAAAMAIAAESGAQTTLMAPTEILAEQHANSIGQLLGAERVRLLTGSLSAGEKRKVHEELAAGEVEIVVGTHALIQAGVAFKQLGLAIVDEQHRFGVEQRAALRQKGHNPHVLVMTATPIPRTLALTLHGDLDISVLDEMPPGRQPVETRRLEPVARERAYSLIRSQVDAGRQAFIICPLVEASDGSEAKAATAEFERLQSGVFRDLRLGLLHGKMKSGEKEAAMAAFCQGETDVMVSTSVVEVGIDVPNASVMLVEGANRFGLAQLHQFRGRVGRGKHKSYCLLLADITTPEAEDRLTALETSDDGYLLAEKDLELRGPGEFFGTRQSGLPDLKLARLSDLETLEQAREEALQLFARDPLLEEAEHRLLGRKVAAFWSGRGDAS